MKVQLVHAVNKTLPVARDKWLAPLNLLSLSTYLEKSNIDVEILDGVHLSQNEILARIDGDIVGINFNIYSTNEMEQISKQAKNKGSLVVLGGHAATSLSRQILNKNKSIDLVVRYDGEEALRQIAEKVRLGKRDFSGIPNLVYRKNKGLVEEKIESLDVRPLPIPDRK